MNIESARKWLKQAKHELDCANKNLNIGCYDVAAFLGQQSVEKLLKAISIYETGTYPKTHSNIDIAESLRLSDTIYAHIAGTSSADYSIS